MAVRRVFRTAGIAVFLVGFVLFARGRDAALIAAGPVPPAPVGLSARVTGTTVVLSWSPGSGTKGSVTYQLEAGSVAGAANLAVFPTKKTSETVAGVPFGSYWVRVRAQNANGLSSPSNEVQLTVGCGAPPPAPSGFLGSVSGTTVSLSWQPVDWATSYTLEVGSAPGASDITTFSNATTSLVANAPEGTYYVRVRAVTPCGTGAASTEQVLRVGTTAVAEVCGNGVDDDGDGQVDEGCTAGGTRIWGIVDAATMGTCSMAIHDTFVVDGGDGWLYRTWHPQTVTVGGVTCTFGHEHGDDPRRMTNSEIAASPVRFGYIGRRMNHEEPHEGFKVFIALPGDVNDEGRRNRVFSRSVFHMGTGGPRRFTMQHHSAEIRLIHPEFGLKAFTQLMMDTGGVGAVCDPRLPAPVKDVVQLNNPCKLNSFYEIWGTTEAVRFQGREIYRAFATPAVFDPITVFNPANPTELVYAWDSRLNTSLNFPNDDRTRFRGCDRESYAQPGYWFNAGTGRTTYYTDAHGAELPASDPNALAQVISNNYSVGAPATNDGLLQFKMRVNYCGQHSALSLKN